MAGSIVGNFLVEIDGTNLVQSQEIDFGEKKNEPFEIYVGNSDLPVIGRGKSKVEEITIKQAYGLNNEAAEFSAMFDDYVRGIDLAKRTVRIIQLDEDGKTPLATHEYLDCVPTGFKPTGKKADSKDAAMFEMKFRPTDYNEY